MATAFLLYHSSTMSTRVYAVSSVKQETRPLTLTSSWVQKHMKGFKAYHSDSIFLTSVL